MPRRQRLALALALAPALALALAWPGPGLGPGLPEGFYVVAEHPVPPGGFDLPPALFDREQIERVGLTPRNVTAWAALMVAWPDEYPTVSRARKALRKGYVLIRRGGGDGAVR